MWLNNVILEDKVLKNERLELKAKDALYHLGPNLTLHGCTLVLQVPAKRLLLPGPCLVNCTVETKRELKNLPWYTASLKGCRFMGRFCGNDFGHWPEGEGFEAVGAVEDCDFTEAILDACRFIGCDTRSLRFPLWPCFTLLNPYQRQHELATFAWPGDVRIAMDFSRGPESTVAVTYLATSLAKQFDTTTDAIKSAIEKLDDVIY